MTPKAAILFKIVHTCVKECLILKYKYVQNPWKYIMAYGLKVSSCNPLICKPNQQKISTSQDLMFFLA